MRQRPFSAGFRKHGNRMRSVGYGEFRAAVCDNDCCWQQRAPSEAGVVASTGSGWHYFLSEKHYQRETCVGKAGRISGMCDAVAVPAQDNRRKLIFLELKSSGQYADAIRQIRTGVNAILAHGVPPNVALVGEIWHKREPKSPIRTHRICEVAGRKVFVRHRKAP